MTLPGLAWSAADGEGEEEEQLYGQVLRYLVLPAVLDEEP